MRHFICGLLVAEALVLVSGCGTKQADAPATPTASNLTKSDKDGNEKTPIPVGEALPPPNLVARVEATWNSKLQYYKEPTKTGTTTGTVPETNCAVSGRVRLFQAEMDKPQEAEGALTVRLYDCSPDSGLAEPLRIQEWHFDGMLLKYFRAENVAAPEYTFVLPWNTYKKEMTQVRIDVTYEPKTGATLTSKGEVLTLDHSELKEHSER